MTQHFAGDDDREQVVRLQWCLQGHSLLQHFLFLGFRFFGALDISLGYKICNTQRLRNNVCPVSRVMRNEKCTSNAKTQHLSHCIYTWQTVTVRSTVEAKLLQLRNICFFRPLGAEWLMKEPSLWAFLVYRNFLSKDVSSVATETKHDRVLCKLCVPIFCFQTVVPDKHTHTHAAPGS